MSEPSLAEVADKTIDHIANGVQQIAQAIERLAPGAWQIAVRQQYMEGLLDLAFGLAGLLVLILGYRALWLGSASWDDDAKYPLRGIIGTVVGEFVILCVCIVHDGILKVATPEYYAATHIMALVHPGQ